MFVGRGEYTSVPVANREFHGVINDAAGNPGALSLVDRHWILVAALWQQIRVDTVAQDGQPKRGHVNPQLMAPIAKGDVIGKVEVKLDEKVVHSADLIALDAVDEGGIFRRMWDSIRLFFYGLFN